MSLGYLSDALDDDDEALSGVAALEAVVVLVAPQVHGPQGARSRRCSTWRGSFVGMPGSIPVRDDARVLLGVVYALVGVVHVEETAGV